MKNILATVLCGAAILASGCSTLHKSDSAALQGTWQGQETRGHTEGTRRIILSGNALEYQGADSNDWCKGTFTLREDTHPRQLIGVISDCPDPQYIGKAVFSIYKLEAGTLTLTGNAPGSPEAPSSFEAPGTRTFVLRKP